jgi:hypothetical protein
MVYKDQQIRMHFYNKWLLEVPSLDFNLSDDVLLDSKPLKSINHGECLRFISKLPK